MSDRRRLSRGDRRRNARLEQLRELVPRDHAVLAIDLADCKQVFALTDHDSRVIARRTVTAHVWELAPTIAWGRQRAIEAGFAGVTLSCEPTGHRWKTVAELAEAAGIDFVCVQPMLVKFARETEDYTNDKSDDKDAMVIARLTAQLNVYVPETPSCQWARLRHLGAHQTRMITGRNAARQQARDLLESVWPAALEAAAGPLRSLTWLAAMSVTGCDPVAITAYDLAAFSDAVREEMPRWGGHRPCARIVQSLYDAAGQVSVPVRDGGALERAAYALADLAHDRHALEEIEASMVEIVVDLGLVELVTSIPGLSAVGAAAILAETGDPARFDSARAIVKHAGLCPRANSSGKYNGKTTISGRGRPRLRYATWRALTGVLGHNPVFADRYRHLTARTANPLKPTQARVALAAALLRQLYAVVTTRTPWNEDIARGNLRALTSTDQEVNTAA